MTLRTPTTFSIIQRFTIEARALDAKTVRLDLEFDPDARPMLRAAS
jgi:hypothetical protein